MNDLLKGFQIGGGVLLALLALVAGLSVLAELLEAAGAAMQAWQARRAVRRMTTARRAWVRTLLYAGHPPPAVAMMARVDPEIVAAIAAEEGLS